MIFKLIYKKQNKKQKKKRMKIYNKLKKLNGTSLKIYKIFII